MRTLLKPYLVIAAVLTSSNAASGQPVAGTAQPNRIDVGTLCLGAIAQASVRVYLHGDIAAGRAAQVDAPAPIKMAHIEIDAKTYRDPHKLIACDVFLTLDTTTEGNFNGNLTIRLGEQRVDVPLVAKIIKPAPDATRVLIAETPFQRFSTSDAAVFEPWLRIVERARLDVSYLEVDRQRPVLDGVDLSPFDVVLLSGGGVYWTRDEDFLKLKKLVYKGGRLIISANHFFQKTVEKANRFVTHYGLEMADEETGQMNVLQVEANQITQHPLTKGVRTLRFFRPSPVAVLPKAKGALLVAAPPYPGRGFAAVTQAGKGEVVVLGESLWWDWIGGERTSGADNIRLLENLLTIPPAATETKTEFPK